MMDNYGLGPTGRRHTRSQRLETAPQSTTAQHPRTGCVTITLFTRVDVRFVQNVDWETCADHPRKPPLALQSLLNQV